MAIAGAGLCGLAAIPLVVVLAFDGTHGPNRFGKDPLDREPEDDF